MKIINEEYNPNTFIHKLTIQPYNTDETFVLVITDDLLERLLNKRCENDSEEIIAGP